MRKPVLQPTGSRAKMRRCQESAENLALEKNKKIITDCRFRPSQSSRTDETERQTGEAEPRKQVWWVSRFAGSH